MSPIYGRHHDGLILSGCQLWADPGTGSHRLTVASMVRRRAGPHVGWPGIWRWPWTCLAPVAD